MSSLTIEKRYLPILEILREISIRANYFMNEITKKGHSENKIKVISLLKTISNTFGCFSKELEKNKKFFPEFKNGIENIQNRCDAFPNLISNIMSNGIERVKSKLYFIQQESNKLYDEINAYKKEI